MANVGYLEGTDPVILTKLAARGIGTVPLSNGFDSHGKYVNHVTPSDHIGVVIGYLHKVIPTPERNMTPADLLFSCITHSIPVLVIVPKPEQKAARVVLGEAADHARLVDPTELYEATIGVVS